MSENGSEDESVSEPAPQDNSSQFLEFENDLGSSPMDEDAMQMHELFLSLVKAGFQENQALRLVAMLIDQANAETIVFTSDSDDDDDDEDD